ncbi:phage terminase, large subunit, PBSX family [Micrococcales bacterium KH10]|nr:phage terminase, large subunit, PBSX family [Micrococcales bacterium KH10]
MNIDMGVSPKQLDFLRNSTTTVSLLEGSIRSGKTIISLLRWLFYIVKAPRGGELVMIGRTRDAVWRNCIAPLQNPDLFAPFDKQTIGNYGAPTVRILGRRVHVLGASDAKAEKVLRGMTVAGAYVDEATTVPEEFFTQLLGRMSVTGAQLFATTNPDNPAHWLRRKFLDRIKTMPHWRSWHFVMDDNPSLTAKYRAEQEANFTGLWYRRFILGEWVAAEGAIYADWDPEKHVIDELPDMDRMIAVGVDHGITNPSAGILLGISGGVMYAADEWWLDGSTMQVKPTVAQQSASLRGWLNDPQHGGQRAQFVCVDPAAAAFRTQLQVDGTTGLAIADNDVAYGIPLVASLLGSGQLKVHKSAENLIREFPGYSWDPEATLKGKDQPIKVSDHALDALRYGITTTESLWRSHLRVAA